MSPRFALAGFLVLTAMGCHHGEHESEEGREVTVSALAKDISVPTEVWDEMQKSEDGSEVDNSKGVQFMGVKVILTEKNPGVLKRSPVKIELPRGGGTIDFAEYVGDNPGSFYVSFEWPEAEDLKEVKTWFVSQARIRNVGDEKWGAGCNKYFRVSAGLLKEMKSGGLKANTTRNFHLSVLGGHFIFALKKHRQLIATQVTFYDSRHPEYFCKEL